MLPREVGVDELADLLNRPDFDPIQEINDVVDAGKTCQEQHPLSVQLMVQLNSQIQDLTEELQASLEQLEKSGKRVPHEIDLLKNDVRRFDDQQQETVPAIISLADEARRSSVLRELASLDEVRRRIESVSALLEISKSGSGAPSEEVREQLAQAFAGTPDESKWTTSSKYYGMFNKMIK